MVASIFAVSVSYASSVVRKYLHQSTSTKTEMKFCVFLPPSLATSSSSSAAAAASRVPTVYWLSGLTCTEDTFLWKAGALRAAAKHNVALVCPDTSPRGLNLPGEKDSWDFGEGAGFYLDATQAPWSGHYNMHRYITVELPELLESAQLGIDAVARRSIMGHSMGGHGALVAFLRNPGMFKSASAFAPISNPSNCDWGRKAFGNYFGNNKEDWKQWDATELVSSYSGPATELLIDQGSTDEFLAKGQLLPEALQGAVGKLGANPKVTLNYRLREGYDHSYYFIQTFIDEHVEFHAKKLQQ